MSDLNYQLSELDNKNKELHKEMTLLKDKLSKQVSIDDLQNQLHRLKLQSEHSQTEYTVIKEENERLKEEMNFVSFIYKCNCNQDFVGSLALIINPAMPMYL